MTIAELIAELQKFPPYADVAVALDYPDMEACDVNGEPIRLNLTPDTDCYGCTEVRNEGTWVQLVGAGPFYPMGGGDERLRQHGT